MTRLSKLGSLTMKSSTSYSSLHPFGWCVVLFLVSTQSWGQSNIEVVTNLGSFVIELHEEQAPLTVDNFLRHTRAEFYNGTIFHRVIQGFVVQAGGYTVDLQEKPAEGSVTNESGNGLSNLRGTVGLARTTDPHSGSTGFYINLEDNLDLNPRPTRWGYTVFGTIIEGMEVIDEIGNVPTGPAGSFDRDVPSELIIIQRIEVGWTPPPERSADNQEPIEASSGTGFFVSHDGHVLTSQHVIDSCQDVQLHANGVRYSVVVIAADRVNDIALLKADLTPPAVFPLSQDAPYLLQDIYAAGYPFGNVVSAAVKVTSGIVSSLVGIGDNVSNLQIDAALQPGNSGGPIIDEYGNAIGIAVAKLDLAQFIEAYETVPENVNFGIRASVAANLLNANNVAAIEPSSSPLSQQALGRRITDGTVYVSCWMTTARIEEVRSRKALFEGL
jgi:peptidyl-prolyl cis-trans isomerase A (cyclophilin A)/peptidyl-prolyl cis-trans isomerase B (cyclophilin B)